MKLFSVVALLAAVASTANAFMINTPSNAVQCQPVLITWETTDSQAPYILSVQPGEDSTGTAIVSWQGLTGNSFTWNVDVGAGRSVSLLLLDSIGRQVRSAPFTILGSSTTCSASSSVGSPVGSSLSTLQGGSSSSLTVSPPSPTPTSTRPPSSLSNPSSVRSSTTSTSTPTGSAGGNTGGALTNVVNFGSVGLLVALVGTILA